MDVCRRRSDSWSVQRWSSPASSLRCWKIRTAWSWQVPSLMPGQSCVCVCVCVCARARPHMHVCVGACMWESMCACFISQPGMDIALHSPICYCSYLAQNSLCFTLSASAILWTVSTSCMFLVPVVLGRLGALRTSYYCYCYLYFRTFSVFLKYIFGVFLFQFQVVSDSVTMRDMLMVSSGKETIKMKLQGLFLHKIIVFIVWVTWVPTYMRMHTHIHTHAHTHTLCAHFVCVGTCIMHVHWMLY